VHPDDSDNKVYEAIGGGKQTVKAEIKEVRERLAKQHRSTGGSQAGNDREPPVGCTKPGLPCKAQILLYT
jgi:hypothetical protein